MNAYSFIFQPIIEGEGWGVKAKKILWLREEFFWQAQGVVWQWPLRLFNAFVPGGIGVKWRTSFSGHFQ